MRIKHAFMGIAAGSFLVLLFYGADLQGQPNSASFTYCERPLGTADAGINPNRLILWRDDDFRNDHLDIADVTRAYRINELHPIRGTLHDNADSIQWNLPPGVIVILYEHTDARNKGRQYAIWGRGQDDKLDNDGIGDRISAWAWYYIYPKN
jgi:hypothetical protein